MSKKVLLVILAVCTLLSVGLWTLRPDVDVPKVAPPNVTTRNAADTLSIPALAEYSPTGRDLKLGRILAREASYTRHYITYKSDSLTISGIMNIPNGKGPFPVLVLNHGFIPPKIYTNGRGLKREQDYFARKGYAVLHSDYRNHADSDKDTLNDLRWRTGYAKDILNAVAAIKNSGISQLDTGRIGMLGHSMGGGITMQVITSHPELVQAAVLYAPVSAWLRDNYYRWSAGSRLGDTLVTLYGTPESNPEFWTAMSPASYFDRIRTPILLQHGTNDESCPYEWSQAIAEKLRQDGKDITFVSLENEKHEFINQWPDFMRVNTEFFDRHLKKR